jgi:hypothetical protein
MRSVDGHVQPDIVSQLRVPAIKAILQSIAALQT